MYKLFLALTFIFSLLTTTTFAAENVTSTESTNNTLASETKNKSYEYTSETYGFKIICPSKPAVVVNPFEDPNKHGELLVFANDGMKIIFGYQIMLEAFDDNKVPNFNRDKKKILDAYINKFKAENAYEFVGIETVAKYSDGSDNKGVVAITAKEIEIRGDNGEIEGTLVADQQSAFTFFRTLSGRCISIQLIASDFNEDNLIDYRKSVATYRDATDFAIFESLKDKKSKKKKK